MKKTFLTLFFFVSLFAFCQKTVPAEVILKNNDTVIGQMKIKVNPFDEKYIYEYSFCNKIKLVSKTGKKINIKAKDISELYFINFYNYKQKFVTTEESKNYLTEEIYINKVRWYKHYSLDSFGGSQKITQYFYDENGKEFSFGLFKNHKKVLKKLTKQNAEIIKFIDKYNMKQSRNILTILKMYEESL